MGDIVKLATMRGYTVVDGGLWAMTKRLLNDPVQRRRLVRTQIEEPMALYQDYPLPELESVRQSLVQQASATPSRSIVPFMAELGRRRQLSFENATLRGFPRAWRKLQRGDFVGSGGGVMAEVLGTWAGLDRRVGAIRRKLLDKPEMEPEVLAEVRARLERVLERLVADGRVRLERPRVVEDLHALLAEIDRRAALH
ncbi:MAG TPA: hypothetical protein VFE60_19000 [Roseiarcus sp.]|jgi:hypothetical protein|nr:hypothetical protein [Roseiarcus sp.]